MYCECFRTILGTFTVYVMFICIGEIELFWWLWYSFLFNVCCFRFNIIMWTILLTNIFILLCVSLRLVLLLTSKDSLSSLTHEGLLLHVPIGVSQCQLNGLFKVYVYNLLCYPLKSRKPFIYGGRVNTLDGTSTPNSVMPNWDFTQGDPLYVGGIQHRQHCGAGRMSKWQVVLIKFVLNLLS